MDELSKIGKALDYLQKQDVTQPRVGIILGSGLGGLAECLYQGEFIPYTDVPYLPPSTVEGHKGQFAFGFLNNYPVAIMQGRYHNYEGYSPQDLVRPVRILGKFGIELLIVTNAVGAINRNFEPGDFMLMTDHINFMGINPLQGPNIDELGPRFPDMTYVYDRELIKIGETVARGLSKNIKKGVYAGVAGPNYETPAEIRMLERMGADVVGMSTVPEALAARHMGLKVMGISCVTNMAAGILPEPLSHEEVVAIGTKVKRPFQKLIKGILAEGVLP